MADVMRDPDLWEENQADLQRLMQVDVLARLAQAKGGVGALGDLVGELESFCTDESIGSEYRVLPALEVVNHLLGTEDLTGARKYVDLALDLMDQPAGGAPENQRSYAASLGARLARAEGASTETLIVIQADLRERVMQMFTRIRERELRIDGYGYFHHGEGRGLLSELIDVTLAVGKKDAKAEALSYLLAAQDCGVLGRYMKWPGADLAAIQEHLIAGDQEHAILVYFPVDWGTHLFMIDAQGVAHFSLEGAGPIEESQQALSVWIGPPTGSFVDLRKRQQATCMKQLAGQLLPSEVLKRLAPITRVTIVHSGLLANLPFEALPMQGTTLGAAKAICYAPSLSVALGLDARQKAKRAERPGPRFQVAFVGAPESEEALAAGRSQIDLPEEFKEAWQVPFHGRVQVHLGASASAENTKSAFATATMAQIFAHGGSDLKEGDPALIYLATGPSSEDGILRPGAMEGWLTPPLVVITACGSGRGATRRGEAPANDFAGTLFRHNTSCVVESAYSIDIEVARRLTLTLNKAVASGLSPAEGMRQLRAELAQENAFDDLYYLSLIRVVGAGHASFF